MTCLSELNQLNGLSRTHCSRALAAVLAAVVLVASGSHSGAVVLYVNIKNTTPAPPYSDWTTAATNIQDAVDAAGPGDTVMVAAGHYSQGGRVAAGTLTNRVVITNALLLQSLSGPAQTVIVGAYALFTTTSRARCLYLGSNATVSGFSLTGGGTVYNATSAPDAVGGGVYCESTNSLVTNCIVANNNGLYGAGVYCGSVNNCVITNNSNEGASHSALNNCLVAYCTSSGASYSTLNNSTVVGNTQWATPPGAAGAWYCSATNCIFYYNPPNQLTAGTSNYFNSYLESCCTWPLPRTGPGNFTNAPRFVNFSSNFRLAYNSPCINAGENAAALPPLDLDGNPRIAGGSVDVGAYEFQAPASTISYAWLQYYRLPTDGSADFADPDADGMNNWQEWRCGTDPTNAASVLKVLSVSNTPGGAAVTWQSVSNRTYSVERAIDLTAPAPFIPIASGVAGQPLTTSLTDASGGATEAAYYRVRVEP